MDGDTTCTSRYCGENEYVSSGACVACAEGYVNAPGDDSRGGVDTSCGACAENFRVSSGLCVACAAGETRAAGDDPLVDGDTECCPLTACCAAGHLRGGFTLPEACVAVATVHAAATAR